MRIISHVAKGREYEIRAIQTAEGWKVETFDEEKRILVRYTVAFELADDLRGYFGDPIKALIDAAKSHLDDGIVKGPWSTTQDTTK
ncbi:MAG: hypothetical protein ABSE79_13505 [Terriglobia bacterium]|jgi:hypothetical protein